jgi:hypothetical protein
LKEAVTPVFGPFVNEIPILLFEYEYEYEYEKNQWYELPAKIMPDGPLNKINGTWNVPTTFSAVNAVQIAPPLGGRGLKTLENLRSL